MRKPISRLWIELKSSFFKVSRITLTLTDWWNKAQELDNETAKQIFEQSEALTVYQIGYFL